MTEMWTIEGAREDMEALIQNVEVDIANLQAALENKDRDAVAKSLTLAQSSVAAALEARETFGDLLLAEKKIEEFQVEKEAQRNLHKIFFFLQHDAERFLVAATKMSKGKRETTPGGGDIGHGVVINRGFGPTPTTTCQIDEELALQQKEEERPEKQECDHEVDDGSKQFPSSTTAKDKTDSGGGSRKEEDRGNKEYGPTPTTTCQNIDEELVLQQTEAKRKKQECECDDDGAKPFLSSTSTTKDDPPPGGGATPFKNSGGGRRGLSSKAPGLIPFPTMCQNDEKLLLQQEEDKSKKKEYEDDHDHDDVGAKRFPPTISTAKSKPPGGGAVKDDDDDTTQFPSSISTARDKPASGYGAAQFEKRLQNPTLFQFNPCLMTGQLEKEEDKPAMRAQPNAHSHQHNNKNALPIEPSEFEKGDIVGGKIPPHFSTAKIKEPPPGGGATKYENNGGGNRGSVPANMKTCSEPTAAILLNNEKDKCERCSGEHPKIMCHGPRGQEGGMKNDDDAEQASNATGINPQPRENAVGFPDVPLVESLKDEQLFMKIEDKVVANQQYGGTKIQQQHHEVVKLCATSAKKMLNPQWWNGPLWLYSPPAQRPDTVGDTVGETEEEEAEMEMRKSLAANMVANPMILPDEEFVERRVRYLHEEAKPRLPIKWTGTGVPFYVVGVGIASPLLLKNNMQSAHRRELDVLLFEVEVVLSNRPLTYLKENPDDPTPLTPNVAVRNSGLPLSPELVIRDAVAAPAAHRRIQDLREVLHSRSRKECQGQLCHQRKMKTPREAAKPGDAVLVEIENEKWPGWPLEAIVKANPGNDCATWTNKVKTLGWYSNRTQLEKNPIGNGGSITSTIKYYFYDLFFDDDMMIMIF